MKMQAFTLLADADRREIIRELHENDGQSTIEDLSHRVADLRMEGSTVSTDSEAVERALISLVHNHLPRLADHGVIEYDRRSGDVLLTDSAELTSTVGDITQTISFEQ